MLYEDVKVIICKIMCISLVKQDVVRWLGVSKMFCSSTSLTIMMESIFSFLSSYFSIIFLAKGKITKCSLFLSLSQSCRAPAVHLK